MKRRNRQSPIQASRIPVSRPRTRSWYGGTAAAYNPPVKALFEETLPPQADPAAAAARLRAGFLASRYRVSGSGNSFTADRGSRFSPIPDSLRRTVRVEAGAGGIRISGSVSGFRAGRGVLASETGAFRAEIAERLAGARVPERDRPPLRAGRIFLACVAAAAAAFLVLGRGLVVTDIDAIRAGHLAWDFFPAAEPLADVPASLPWISAGFLAGTAGLAVGVVLWVLFCLGGLLRPLAEILGGTLAWSSVFLVTALVTGPSGNGVGLARSMMDAPGLGAVALVPWVAWWLARPGMTDPGKAGPGRTRRRVLFAASLAAVLLPLLASDPPETPDPRDAVRTEIAREYLHHAFRDRWLLENAVGERLNALYYRYTPYAGLLTGAATHPERVSLRLMAEGGTFLWLAMPLALAAAAIAWGADRFLPRRFPAPAAALALLAALAGAGIAWPLLPSAGPDPGAWRERLADGNGRTRAEAFHAAALLAEPGDAPALRPGLSDPDARARLWSVTALARLTDWESFPEIARRLADDPHFLVRSRATDALRLYAARATDAPGETLAKAARALGATEADPAPRRRLADAVLPGIIRAAAREEFAYIRRRLLAAETAWETVRSR